MTLTILLAVLIAQLLVLVLILHARCQRLEREAGVTQRDELAKAAMQGLLAGHIAHHGHENYWPPKDLADFAYEHADAMLKARQA